MFFSLLKNVHSFKITFYQYGGKSDHLKEKYLKKVKEESRDTYQDCDTLYSSEENRNNCIRPLLIDFCISEVKKDERVEINELDLVEALFNIHDKMFPIIDNISYNDERFHTAYNTIAHLLCMPNEDIWVKFDDIRTDIRNYSPYDLAISFAGEDRAIARIVAEEIKRTGLKVFYDEYEKANLWGKDLYCHLSDIYSKKAKYCLMIISQYYADKQWTNHERKAAQAKAIEENHEYILPLRLDDTEVPGLLPTIGYVDFRTTTLDEVIGMIKSKLGHN